MNNNMQQILLNLALIDTLEFCTKNKIDCSDTHIYKYPRRYTYALLSNKTNRAIVTTTFYKHAVPTHFIN